MAQDRDVLRKRIQWTSASYYCQRDQPPGGIATNRIKTRQFECDIASLGGHVISVCICNQQRFASPSIPVASITCIDYSLSQLSFFSTKSLPASRRDTCFPPQQQYRCVTNEPETLSIIILFWNPVETMPRRCNNKALLLFD